MKKVNITMKEDSYSFLEAIRTLRTNIQFSGDDKQIIMVTSCLPREGKTEMSIALANSLAEIDKKVILIDADMRKSYMAVRLEAQGVEYGLSHVLSGQCAVGEAICSTNISKMHILFSGPMAPNPTELLETKRFEGILNAMRSVYDYIIIDCPPLGLVVDAAVIAKKCDGSIFVVEADSTKYRLAQDVRNKLVGTKTQILGVVLNKIDVKRNKGYYSKYYGKRYGGKRGYGYGYGGEGYGYYGVEKSNKSKKKLFRTKQDEK